MQTFAIVHILDKMFDRCVRLLAVAIVLQVHFFVLHRLHETFGARVIVRISGTTHADQKTIGFEQRDVVARRVLHAAISERALQGRDRKRSLERIAEFPAHRLARVRISIEQPI